MLTLAQAVYAEKWTAVVSSLLLAGIVCVLTAAGVAGQSAKPAAAPKVAATTTSAGVAGAPEMTAADVDAFFDGFVPMQVLRDDIAGAVVVVVKDGKVLYSKGFGYADAENKKPVSVDDTLFRPGSVSKLFVWTSVMQLVEQGKLDLDHDVNEYLDFKIKATYPEPVTLRRIMTHTSGFEEVVKDLFISDAGDLKPLREYLVARQPERIFAPGTVPAYSNYATALAGYIVQRISGEKFEDYIANHIYKPLGMAHTTFVQPLSKELEPLMSKGYMLASDGPKPYEVVQAAPAGSVATSGGDMAKFMIAHLQDGRYGDTQILKLETAKLMHARSFAPDPKMLAMALGFFEETRNGHYGIGHGGDTQYFHSHLHLIPDANVGLFISVNSLGKAEADLREMLWEKFTDRYFPNTAPAEATLSTAKENAAEIAGSYLSSRRAESNFLKGLSMISTASAAPQPDGTIEFDFVKGFNGKPRHWREIAPMLYQDVDGQDRLFFRRDSSGRMQIFTFFAAFGFQKAAWYETKGFNLFLPIFFLTIFILTLVIWPIAGLVRRHYKLPLALTPGEIRLRRWTRLVCLFDVVVILLWTILVSYAGSVIGRFNSRLDPWLYIIQFLGILAALGTIVAIVNAFRSITSARWWWSKIHDVLVALACLGFVWFGMLWRLFHVSAQF